MSSVPDLDSGERRLSVLETTAEQQHRTRLAVARNANNPEERALFLAMLGLVPDGKRIKKEYLP